MRWLFALALMLVGSVSQADTFRFTAIPDEDQSRLVERFSKVADYLSDKLGVEVEYVPVTSYGAAVTAFRNDQVQLAWFGGLSGVQARRLVPGSQAIAQGKEDAEFRSYFIANTQADIAPSETALPEAVRGHSFTFGAKLPGGWPEALRNAPWAGRGAPRPPASARHHLGAVGRRRRVATAPALETAAHANAAAYPALAVFPAR